LAVVIIGAITDYRKEKQFIALYMEQEEEDKKYFTLIREGRRHALTPHSDLLVGDLVDIQPGDALTFDGIMIRGSAYVDVDESMITGLTHTLKKRPFHP
jgi:P-type E1-E2 ATPase